MFEKHGVSPSRVELEITETTLMLDAERTLPLLDELRAMGVHLSIDDFGTGYSSLSALQQFPIGTLKIDQSFVRNAASDPDDATIVRTIIEMGRSLGLQVLAEGIETEEQRSFLLRERLPVRPGPPVRRAGVRRRVPGDGAAAGDGQVPDPAPARLNPRRRGREKRWAGRVPPKRGSSLTARTLTRGPPDAVKFCTGYC